MRKFCSDAQPIHTSRCKCHYLSGGGGEVREEGESSRRVVRRASGR
jgi:hypothetical protein